MTKTPRPSCRVIFRPPAKDFHLFDRPEETAPQKATSTFISAAATKRKPFLEEDYHSKRLKESGRCTCKNQVLLYGSYYCCNDSSCRKEEDKLWWEKRGKPEVTNE